MNPDPIHYVILRSSISSSVVWTSVERCTFESLTDFGSLCQWVYKIIFESGRGAPMAVGSTVPVQVGYYWARWLGTAPPYNDWIICYHDATEPLVVVSVCIMSHAIYTAIKEENK